MVYLLKKILYCSSTDKNTATETDFEFFCIQSEQSYNGLVATLWVDIKTLYVLVNPLSFNDSWYFIFCLHFGMKTLIYQT